ANIFEGIVLEDEADHLLIESEAAGCQFYITRATSTPVGSTVSIAIRPEKVMLSRTAPAGNRNCTKGFVREIGYLGDMSIY
ncbi:TOBE domain-containing protein, partial [Staphylococcus aureus]